MKIWIGAKNIHRALFDKICFTLSKLFNFLKVLALKSTGDHHYNSTCPCFHHRQPLRWRWWQRDGKGDVDDKYENTSLPLHENQELHSASLQMKGSSTFSILLCLLQTQSICPDVLILYHVSLNAQIYRPTLENPILSYVHTTQAARGWVERGCIKLQLILIPPFHTAPHR